MASTIPSFPTGPTGFDYIYCTTDPDAERSGCRWGLVVAHIHGDFWVLTSIGIRYYGVESEHTFWRRGDAGWDAINATWQRGLSEMANAQS